MFGMVYQVALHGVPTLRQHRMIKLCSARASYIYHTVLPELRQAQSAQYGEQLDRKIMRHSFYHVELPELGRAQPTQHAQL